MSTDKLEEALRGILWTRNEDDDRLYFNGNERNFETWRSLWFSTVPHCLDFVCCHELMSCGIGWACGECSSFKTMQCGSAHNICTSVDCIDCLHKYNCMYGQLTEEQRTRYSLSYVPLPNHD